MIAGLFRRSTMLRIRVLYGRASLRNPAAGKLASDRNRTRAVRGYFFRHRKPSSRTTRVTVQTTAHHNARTGRYGDNAFRRPKRRVSQVHSGPSMGARPGNAAAPGAAAWKGG